MDIMKHDDNHLDLSVTSVDPTERLWHLEQCFPSVNTEEGRVASQKIAEKVHKFSTNHWNKIIEMHCGDNIGQYDEIDTILSNLSKGSKYEHLIDIVSDYHNKHRRDILKIWCDSIGVDIENFSKWMILLQELANGGLKLIGSQHVNSNPSPYDEFQNYKANINGKYGNIATNKNIKGSQSEICKKLTDLINNKMLDIGYTSITCFLYVKNNGFYIRVNDNDISELSENKKQLVRTLIQICLSES